MGTNNNPINISLENITGNCDLKCAYNFNYITSNSTATNRSFIISLTYDNASVPPVSFNTQSYNVSSVSIYSPSIHIFNNNKLNAEILITHTPVAGGSLLYVCIPVISSIESSSASNLLTEIIESVASNAPSNGETTNLNINDFTLNTLVPMKPFFNYTSPDANWIVFGAINAIPLSSTTLTSLSQITKPFPLQLPGNKLFFNSLGPTNLGTGSADGLYISCQPTGNFDGDVAVEYNKNSTSGSFLNNPIVILILTLIFSSIIFIIVLIVLNYTLNFIGSFDTITASAVNSLKSLKSKNSNNNN